LAGIFAALKVQNVQRVALLHTAKDKEWLKGKVLKLKKAWKSKNL